MHATPGCTAKKESACNIARGRNAEAKNHVGGSISLCTEGVPRGHRGVRRPSDFFDELTQGVCVIDAKIGPTTGQ